MEDSRKPLEESRPVLRRKRRRQRRKRSSNSEAPLSPHCHHSALADKSSDYEDIWGTSPGDSHDDEADEEGEDEEETPIDPRPVVLAHEEDTTLSERCCSMSSGRSSVSTMEKPASDHPISSPTSRSLTSSPEQLVDLIEPEVTIEPPESFQEERKSITIIEIRHSPVPIEAENDDCGGPEDKENNVPEPPALVILAEDAMIAVRRRSCSSNESNNNSRNNSRRTSPLYSEPADAIPPNQQPPPSWTKKQQQQLGRPLPQPPASGVTASMDFQTFTKDGYVRCTLPPLPQSSSSTTIHPNRVTVLPSITSSGPMNNRSKQVVMPKPPRQIPAVTVRDPPPAAVYLPTATEDDSLTIQVRKSIRGLEIIRRINM